MSEKEHLDEPMFFSSYLHALDAQCRVALPSEWRRQGAEMSFVLMPARDQALVLLPRPVFAEFVSRTRKLAIANPRMQMALEKMADSNKAMSESNKRLCRMFIAALVIVVLGFIVNNVIWMHRDTGKTITSEVVTDAGARAAETVP